MFGAVKQQLEQELGEIRSAGLYKRERQIRSPQRGAVRVGDTEVLNLCANNYLGLADHPEVIGEAHAALDRWGYGMASVRFICGTQEIHVELEQRLSEFLGTEATILYGSCFDANGGVFEALLDKEDAVISDALNHASIIDGIRLSKARRLRYSNGDLEQLESLLLEAADARRKLIVTDGVFSMDGYIARLDGICELAERHEAMVMVDDSHAVGFVGPTGRGTPELFGVVNRVDIVTGTLGKALGGASGGYVSGRAEIVELLRQVSRPYLFSNAVAPVIAATSLAVLDLLDRSDEQRRRLRQNTELFRREVAALGYNVLPGEHPIVPVMFGEAPLAVDASNRLFELGIYAIPFSYPVVPMGEARIRAQMSAAHTEAEVRRAIDAFGKVIKP